MRVAIGPNRFFAGNLVDERCREQRVELHTRRAAIALAAVRPALIADFFEIGVEGVHGGGSCAHARNFCISRAKRKLTASVSHHGGAHAGLRKL